jgi:hypothetical protein
VDCDREMEVKNSADSKTAVHAPDWMIIDAVRYCIGRQSYQVSVTCRWLIENWESIPQSAKDVIVRDLEEAKAHDDRNRRGDGMYFPLGQDMDRREWLAVLTLARCSSSATPSEAAPQQ